MFKLPKKLSDEGAVAPVFILVAAIGLIAFFAVTNTFNFKNSLFGQLFLKTPSHAAGATYYVDCNSGNDINFGTSTTSAWKNLSRANSANLVAGDSLLFKKGCTWKGPLTAKWNGSASSPITISGYGSGNNPKIYNTDSSGNIVKVTGSYQVIDGLETGADVTSTDPSCGNNPVGYITGFQLSSGSNNTVQNSKASGLYAGVFITTGSSHNKVLNNQFINNNMMSVLNTIPDSQPNGGDSGAFGVLLNGDDNEVAYNTISGSDACSYDYGRDGSATEVYYGSRNFVHHNIGKNNDAFTELGSSSTRTATDNTFAYNLYTSTNQGSAFLVTRGVGIPFGPVYRTVAYNNTAYLTGSIDSVKNKGPQGFVCSGCGSDILTVKNNIIWANWKGIYAGGSAPVESNNIFWPSTAQIQGLTLSPTSKKVNPLFVSPGTDFHLQASSTAKDAGVNVGLTSDLDSNLVPFNGGVDVGGYEFGSHPATSPSPSPAASASVTPPPSVSPSPSVSPTTAPTPVATAPLVAPAVPLVSIIPTCIATAITGTADLTISWTNPVGHPVTSVDISDTSNFTIFYYKVISGSASTSAPVGFVHGTTTLLIQPGTTYYTRLWNGLNSSSSPFNIPLCGGGPGSSPSPTATSAPTVPPDTQAPTVSITAPTVGQVISQSSNVTFSANAVDNAGGSGVARVEFYDGTNLLRTVSAAPYTFSWNTTQLAQGSSHNLKAKAIDNSGNQATSQAIIISIADTTKPFVSVNPPADQSTVAGTSVSLQAPATDNIAVAKEDILVDGKVIFSQTNPNNSQSFTASYTWDSTSVLDGTHQVTATATDISNNTASSTPVGVTVKNVDTTPPSVPTNLALASATFSAVSITWTGATDDRGVGGYYIISNNKTIGQTTSTSYTDSTVLENQSYSYQVIAFDTSNNPSQISASLAVTTPLSPDIQGPTAPTSLVASANSTSQINLSWIASTDNRGVVGYDVYRNGNKIATISTTTYGDAGLAASSAYSYYIVAFDGAGNKSVNSQIVSATTQPPSVSTGNIIGQVTNSIDSAIVQASISINMPDGSTQTYLTDSNGNYTITDINAATYNITYSKAGYVSQARSVIVTAGVTTTQSISLKNIPANAPMINVAVNCIDAGYSGSGVSVYWTNPTIAVRWVDISDNSSFTPFYHKDVTGIAQTQTNAPDGFNLNGSATLLTLNPSTTYYTRLWNGSHSELTQFSIQSCSAPSSPSPVPDITGPSITITYPANGTVPRKTQVATIATITDQSGVGRVDFYTSQSTAPTCANVTSASSTYTCPWSSPAKPGTQVNITVFAYDKLNNVSSTSIVVTSR